MRKPLIVHHKDGNEQNNVSDRRFILELYKAQAYYAKAKLKREDRERVRQVINEFKEVA
jgi:hypothetical protein|tara:strand:- start:248 stop:424 length:177 start_codon:yes stop_codon:yes gene_type:complete